MINNNKILKEIVGSTATIWFNHPEKQNALDIEMISALLFAIRQLNANTDIRIIVIRGKGESFSAGADLNWMQKATTLTPTENFSECEALALCFYELYTSNKITICLVHGSSIGGANGIVAACDIAFSDSSALFAFSEVRIGLIPATIAPYVMRKTGKAKASELMFTGRRFSAAEAENYGLINKAINANEFEEYYAGVRDDLLNGAPLVQVALKAHLRMLDKPAIDSTTIEYTAAILAETRIASEAKEGISAFLQKRKPLWVQEK